jgi:Putative adhesin
VEIDGGSAAVEVRRVDRFAFGHPATERRSVQGGVLTLVSRCPHQVLGACRAAYRLSVPDNVPVTVRTSSGAVRLSGVRASVQVNTGSGAIAATGFCGHALSAVSDSGTVSAGAECSVEQLTLRSRSGDVHAVVPAGRYRVDAESDSGSSRVRGVTSADDALFQVQALSTSGNVTVDGAAS